MLIYLCHQVRAQYEIYPSHTEQASRQVLVIHDIEMRDRLEHSNINKFLYQYSSEWLPRQTHANMVSHLTYLLSQKKFSKTLPVLWF